VLANLADIPGFLRFVVKRWREDRCPTMAGSLTYTTILALAPTFAIGVALLSTAPFFHDVMEKFRIFLRANLAPEVANTIITTYLPQFAHNAMRLGSLSLAMVLVIAVWLLLMIDRSLNTIWGTRQARPYWVSGLGYAALIVAAPILIGVSVTVTTRLAMLSSEVAGGSSELHAVILRGVPTAVTTLAFFLVYRIIPHQPVPWRHALLGGFVAAVLFEGAKEVFAVYVRVSPTYSRVYGPFAAIPLFLVWIYFSWLVVLLGAELTACAAYWRGRRWKASRRGPRLAESLAIGSVLLRSKDPLPFPEIARRTLLPVAEVEEALAQMIEAGIARRQGRQDYELAPATREALSQQLET
jgi:membrane protein